jgi:hypothetical protein
MKTTEQDAKKESQKALENRHEPSDTGAESARGDETEKDINDRQKTETSAA